MQLSLDGERSIDPAMVDDWVRAVGNQTSFNRDEGLSAARRYLENCYEIGPQDEIKATIDAMAVGPNGVPIFPETSATWNVCWDMVCESLRTGEPFRTAYAYGTTADGKPRRAQWNRHPRLEFIED